MLLLSLAAALSVAVVGSLAPDAPTAPPAPAPSDGPIQVGPLSHEVRFPDEILLTLEAEGSVPITEVELSYRLSGPDTRIFAYADFEPGLRVTVSFILKTGGASYIPSGVEIEYYYRIVDESGTAVETERRTVQYLDPAFEWRQVHAGDLAVVWHDIPRERVEAVAANVGERLDAVKRLLGLDGVSPMTAVIVNGRREALQTFPVISDAARRGHLYGGFAFGDYRLFMLAGLGEEGMVHEATHLLLDQAASSPRARVPAWLNEGLAMYFERESAGRTAAVANALRDGSLLRLESMNTVPGRPDDVRLFYAQAAGLVRHMVDTYGERRMASLLGAVNSGVPVDEAAAQVYGMSPEEMDRQWHSGLAGTTALAPRPDPGTVGTSFIVTGALLIAFFVSAYRWGVRRSEAAEPEEPDGWAP